MENVDNQRKNGNAKKNVRHNNEPVRNVCANLAPSSNQANGDSWNVEYQDEQPT